MAYVDAILSKDSATSTLANFYSPKYSSDVENMYFWMEWIIFGNHPFSFVENKLTLKNSKRTPVCTKTLQKYMHEVAVVMYSTIERMLKNRNLGLMFDGIN